MKIFVQFLEGGPDSARLPPREARNLLRSAFGRLPIDNVLLGWNLPPALLEACAVECDRQHAALYLWQPLLAGDGVFEPRPGWRTIGLNGIPVGDPKDRMEFTFVCPNRVGVRDAVLDHLDDVLAGGFFQGVFLDRIRFPSPAENPGRNLACFCEDCRRAAESAGVDLAFAQNHLALLLQTPEGKRAAVRSFLSAPRRPPQPCDDWLERLLAFRCRSIAAFVADAAGLARARGLKVGLDCFSPTLARMVGQDLAELAAHCDWIKGMTYIRAYGPASIPFELLGLTDWIRASDQQDESQILAFLADAAEWDLPPHREVIRREGLPSTVLAEEIGRGRDACTRPFLAGIELVEMPGVAALDPERIRADLEALHAAAADGIVLSWDLRFIPAARLEMVNGLFSRRHRPGEARKGLMN